MFEILNRNCVQYIIEFLEPGHFINMVPTNKINSQIFTPNTIGIYAYETNVHYDYLTYESEPITLNKVFDVIHSLVDIYLPSTWSYQIYGRFDSNRFANFTYCNSIVHPNHYTNIPSFLKYDHWVTEHFINVEQSRLRVDNIFNLPLMYHIGDKSKYRSLKALL